MINITFISYVSTVHTVRPHLYTPPRLWPLQQKSITKELPFKKIACIRRVTFATILFMTVLHEPSHDQPIFGYNFNVAIYIRSFK